MLTLILELIIFLEDERRPILFYSGSELIHRQHLPLAFGPFSSALASVRITVHSCLS
jgi:hypothetical protein